MAEPKPRKVAAPRPAYIIYKLGVEDTGAPTMDIIDVVRKAEDVLALVDKNEGSLYKRFSLK